MLAAFNEHALEVNAYSNAFKAIMSTIIVQQSRPIGSRILWLLSCSYGAVVRN